MGDLEQQTILEPLRVKRVQCLANVIGIVLEDLLTVY